MTRRRGTTLPEAVVALTLLGLVVHLTWAAASGARRAAAALEDGAALLAAERTAWWVLRDELATALPGRDRGEADGDSVALRAFRGAGPVCPGDGGDGGDGGGGGGGVAVRVRYAGVRAPEPAKDSVLALGAGGRWTAVDLVAVDGPAPCGGSPGAWTLWRLGSPVPGAALLRVFERGSYHVADGALRYRRGAAGRQPLTPAVLDRATSGLRERGYGVEVRVGENRWARTARSWVAP